MGTHHNYVIKIFLILLGLSIGGTAARQAWAEAITFEFTGEVYLIVSDLDPSNPAPPIGSTLSGSYTFDSATVDADPDPSLGFYHCAVAPCGFSVQLEDGRIVSSDPLSAFVRIGVNDGADQYVVAGVNPGGNGSMGFNIIGFEMFSGDSLLLVPPAMPWPNTPSGNLDNAGSTWAVAFHLTSLTLRTVDSSLSDLKELVSGLSTGSFKGDNMLDALTNKIDAAIAQVALIEAETDPTARAMMIDDLRDKVVNDILRKGNGCGTSADANDWITDCTAQAQFQAQIQAILDLIDAL